MRLLKTVLITLFFIIAITFAIKNQESVSLQYYFFDNVVGPMPLFLLVFFSILVGVLITGVGCFFTSFKLKQDIKRQQKIISEQEKELYSLRNMPIMESKHPYE
ncbi:MAG: LapA family protein [Pseudomonadota bacterium]